MRLRDETPTSGYRSIEASSPERTHALTRSLASIDSEGSWLSGGKGGTNRGSAQFTSHPRHDSASSLRKRYLEYSESAEKVAILEDVYFHRLTPGPDDQNMIQRQSAAIPSSDEEDSGSIGSPTPYKETKWGTIARRPTVVHREPQAKSREGLRSDYEIDSGGETAEESPSNINRTSYGFNKDLIEEDEPSVQRALSVDLGQGHMRRISAGSARLVDLKKGNGERLSYG